MDGAVLDTMADDLARLIDEETDSTGQLVTDPERLFSIVLQSQDAENYRLAVLETFGNIYMVEGLIEYAENALDDYIDAQLVVPEIDNDPITLDDLEELGIDPILDDDFQA